MASLHEPLLDPFLNDPNANLKNDNFELPVRDQRYLDLSHPAGRKDSFGSRSWFIQAILKVLICRLGSDAIVKSVLVGKVATPICIPQRNFIDIGRIASIKNNDKPVDIAKMGMTVSIKIVGIFNSAEQQKMVGRHFKIKDELVSHISMSIDALKISYRDDLSIDEWKLVVKLKKRFGMHRLIIRSNVPIIG